MLDALTLDQIRTFVAVADSGSFRAGAGSLSRAQSGVSVAVANLEAQLGLLLFDRSGHRPVLTPQGEALLADARDILLRVDAMRARARGFGDGVELRLSIVVDTLFPLSAVGAALAGMRAHYPSVAIRLEVQPLGGPLQALTDQRCTLAIMVGEDFRDPRISFEALSPVSQVAVVAAGHPLAAGRGLGVPDLADHVQIVLSDPTALSEGRDFGVLSPQSCRVTSQDAKHALILSGVGWGRLPLWLVEDDLSSGRLVRLPTTALGRDGQVQAQSYLARRLDQPFGPAARSFAAALTESCRA
ncbi:LysR family transcriptional regulator [Paracoccus siganidrum]|uniref:LysR family transcriptional regulator n=1 Tax=Paracoccus siganidrum TaxID=1276757 RepID=A0A419A7J5_9RHOB|nr:LysR family transcriptional regulator [Paracoccus siganidrum]RJL16428.1 LysR family transcriptional regulator [Paracoccus siganidrum]RMC30167.1 LysR family transcriptional regulator [Paracoccus siganidrum]